MQSTKQRQAIWMWQSLPHLLIWGGLFLFIIGIGYGQSFSAIQPAIPLMVALIWAWEERSPAIALSLLLSGFCLDMLSGMPFGWYGLLWASTYLIAPLILRAGATDDEPFIVRWLTCGGWLALYMFAELLLIIAYDLAAPTIISFIFRLLLMFLFLPLASWIAWRLKKVYYRKLWMHLPEEMRISF